MYEEERLKNEDFLELDTNQNYNEVEEAESEKLDEKVLTLKGLSKAFQLIEGHHRRWKLKSWWIF